MTKRPTLFYGWVIVATTVVGMILIYGIRHSFPVFFSPILNEFHWRRGDIAMMLSLNILIYGLLSPIAGILVDRWKARKMIPLGITLLSLATVGCGFADELWHFYLFFGFLMPIGSAFSGWPIMAPTLMNWFIKRRGLVLGLAHMGGGLSFAYSMVTELIISQFGWRSTFFILAGILMLLLLPLIFFFFYYRPIDLGLKPYGIPEDSSADDWTVRSPVPTEGTLGEVLRRPQLWLLVLSYALFWGIGCYLVLAHQVKFTEDAGYSSVFSVSVFALFGLTVFIGQLSGFLSDWMGREKAATLASVISIGALFALISVRDTSQPWLLYVYSTCFGYGAGLFAPSTFAATADLFPGRHFGVAAGLLLTGMGIGGAFGPSLGGYLFDLSGNYIIAFSLSIGSIGLACLLLWVAAPRKRAKERTIFTSSVPGRTQ